jgi:hypothetical protein
MSVSLVDPVSRRNDADPALLKIADEIIESLVGEQSPIVEKRYPPFVLMV